MWAVWLAVGLMQEPFQDDLAHSKQAAPIQQQQRLSKPLDLGKPDMLINYAEFRKLAKKEDQSAVEHSRRSLLFGQNTIEIGLKNFATLTGYDTMFLRQSLLYSDLTMDEQDELDRVSWSPDETYINSTGIDGREMPVTAGLMDTMFNRGEPKMPPGIIVDQTDCLDEVRSQKKCGLCYAFSFIALLEWHYCKQSGGKKLDFSEQFILDCGQEHGLLGCDGGTISGAKEFTNFRNLKLEEHYPYKGKRQLYGNPKYPCPDEVLEANQFEVGIKIPDWLRLERTRENFENILKEQPIVVEVHLPFDYRLGGKGIANGLMCNNRMPHGMLLVGYGEQNGRPYWLLRNSHGRWRNENGYFRLSRDMSFDQFKKCFKSGFIASPHFASLGEEAHEKLYGSFEREPIEAAKELVTSGLTKLTGDNWKYID
jgi:hypothetical protein